MAKVDKMSGTWTTATFTTIEWFQLKDILKKVSTGQELTNEERNQAGDILVAVSPHPPRPVRHFRK